MSLFILTTCLGLMPGNATNTVQKSVTAGALTATNSPDKLYGAGPLPIVSRLGTTLAPYTAVNQPYFNGDSVQVPTYNTAVKIIRPHRNLNRKNVTKTETFNNIRKENDTVNVVRAQRGACVPTGTCIRSLIDVRIVTPQVPCPTGQEYCGRVSTKSDLLKSNISCGVTQTVPSMPFMIEPGQASFGEIPWQGALIAMPDYVTGVVLIDELNVLTVSHKVTPYLISGVPDNLVVRLGDWAKVRNDPVSYKDYPVGKVFSHPMFNPNTLENDIAILRLASGVSFTPSPGVALSINRACLPSSPSLYMGQRCMVSGRGYQMFGPKAFIKEIRKKVEVSIVESEKCQSLLKEPHAAADFKLPSSSFICARGENDDDACVGDGGSGLLCEVEGKWEIVGLFTRGLGCGSAKIPGVYVNVSTFLPWIQETIAKS